MQRPPGGKHPSAHRVALTVDEPRRIGAVRHALTHRRYEFDVYVCNARAGGDVPAGPAARAWVTVAELDAYPLPRPHLKVAELIRRAASGGRSARG